MQYCIKIPNRSVSSLIGYITSLISHKNIMIKLIRTYVTDCENIDHRIPVNHDFPHKQRNHKTDLLMKTDQSVKLFGQMPNYSCPTNYVYKLGGYR